MTQYEAKKAVTSHLKFEILDTMKIRRGRWGEMSEKTLKILNIPMDLKKQSSLPVIHQGNWLLFIKIIKKKE